MKILGIDPGLECTGWGIIEDGYRVGDSVAICGVTAVKTSGDVRGQTRLTVRQLSYVALE
jgi:Holliday junction resolvasome RuvABC endonuclease subunit